MSNIADLTSVMLDKKNIFFLEQGEETSANLNVMLGEMLGELVPSATVITRQC